MNITWTQLTIRQRYFYFFSKRTSVSLQLFSIPLDIFHQQILTWQFIMIRKMIDNSIKFKSILFFALNSDNTKSELTDYHSFYIRYPRWINSDKSEFPPNRNSTHRQVRLDSNLSFRNCSPKQIYLNLCSMKCVYVPHLMLGLLKIRLLRPHIEWNINFLFLIQTCRTCWLYHLFSEQVAIDQTVRIYLHTVTMVI